MQGKHAAAEEGLSNARLLYSGLRPSNDAPARIRTVQSMSSILTWSCPNHNDTILGKRRLKRAQQPLAVIFVFSMRVYGRRVFNSTGRRRHLAAEIVTKVS